MTAQEKLAAFGAKVLREHHRVGEIDDKTVQKMALATGVFEWIEATTPCGGAPACFCAHQGFPQECLRIPPDVAAACQ